MNAETRRPLLLAIAAASVLTVGGLAWLARGLFAPAEPVGSPSLLEWLNDSRQPGTEKPERQQRVPAPPAHEAWISPLRQTCPIREPALQKRLGSLLAELDRRRRRVPIDPSNYGQRYKRDVYGNRLDPTPRMVVLHETVYGLSSALNTFRTPHPNDDDQVSYHTLIGQNGAIVDTVDPSRRAFGAGHSAFQGRWAVTSRRVSGSINNFALHLSLESPLDGENEAPGHSGYTSAQYDAAAVVLADWMRRYPIPVEAITTHRHVDMGRERADPRNFDWSQLRRRLAALGVIC
jgi:N-acetyl-anhydromuramyl-L-alanine amidase AmpD